MVLTDQFGLFEASVSETNSKSAAARDFAPCKSMETGGTLTSLDAKTIFKIALGPFNEMPCPTSIYFASNALTLAAFGIRTIADRIASEAEYLAWHEAQVFFG